MSSQHHKHGKHGNQPMAEQGGDRSSNASADGGRAEDLRTPAEQAMGSRQPGASLPSEEVEVEQRRDDAGAELEVLRSDIAQQGELIAKQQRAIADMDNHRKRLERQMEEHRKYAMQSFVAELLPVIDNFERALGSAGTSQDFTKLHDGLQLVHDQLLEVLKRYNIEPIAALGRPFDPNFHEAIQQREVADQPDNTVVDVAQNGYTLHQRTVRPSRVVVSRRPE